MCIGIIWRNVIDGVFCSKAISHDNPILTRGSNFPKKSEGVELVLITFTVVRRERRGKRDCFGQVDENSNNLGTTAFAA